MSTHLTYQFGSHSELANKSLKLYMTSFSQIFLISILFSALTFLPRFLTALFGSPATTMSLLYPQLMIAFFINIVALIIFMALLFRMHCVKFNCHEPLAEDFSVALKKIFNAIIAAIIQNLILFATNAIIIKLQLLILHQTPQIKGHFSLGFFIYCLFLLQFFLSVYLSTLFLFLIPIIAVEKVNIFRAIEKSVLLVWNHWWRVFSLQIIPWIFYLIVLTFIRYGLNIDIRLFLFSSANQSLIAIILHMLIFALVIPWAAALLLVQLDDLEQRKRARLQKFTHAAETTA